MAKLKFGVGDSISVDPALTVPALASSELASSTRTSGNVAAANQASTARKRSSTEETDIRVSAMESMIEDLFMAAVRESQKRIAALRTELDAMKR